MMFLQNLIAKTHSTIFGYEPVLKYLHSRFVTDDEIRQFKIGYSKVVTLADDGTEDYREISAQSHKGRKLENKIILPIFDMMGTPVGMITRSPEVKKYGLYLTRAGKDLGAMFGLYQALPAIYLTDCVFIVEGSFDLLAFRKARQNVVATNTAELTKAQYEQLRFYADNIITVFDSDGPGRAATERAKENFSGIQSMDLGFKDPSNCLAYCGTVKKFSERVESKAGEHAETWVRKYRAEKQTKGMA